MTLSTTEHDFGTTVIGNRSAALRITVSNAGTTSIGALSVGLAGPTSGDFEISRDDCSGTQLSGGGSCVIEVEIVPTALGPREALLAVSAPGGERVIATLRGVGSSSGISVSPSVVAFGETGIGQTGALKTVVLRNTALLATGTIAVGVTGAGAASFTITRDVCTGTSLVRGASCAVDVRFVPASGGSLSATLSASAPSAPTVSAQLLGVAGEPTTLTADPSGSHSFGAQEVGSGGGSATFVIANTGPRSTGALSIQLAGPNPGDFQVFANGCYPNLVVGATCSIQVSFSPSASGMRTAAVKLSDAYGTALTIDLAGEGLPGPAPETKLTLSPAGSFSFPPTLIAATVMQTVTVTNPASTPTGPLSTSVHVCNDYYYYGCYPSPSFKLENDTCDGIALPAGGSCTISIAFTPTFTGFDVAQFDVYAPGFSGTLGLSGTGVGLHASINSVEFASTPVGGTSASQTVVITNTGPASTGTLATEVSGFVFEIVSNTCAGASLPPGGFCTMTVRFKPTAPGGRYGSVGVNATPGGTLQLQLFGVGL